MSCSHNDDSLTMHTKPGRTLGCADCHGGNAKVVPRWSRAAGERTELTAAPSTLRHIQPRYPEEWNYPSSVKPHALTPCLNREIAEFIRFLNPSDTASPRSLWRLSSAHHAAAEPALDGDHRRMFWRRRRPTQRHSSASSTRYRRSLHAGWGAAKLITQCCRPRR